MRILLAHPDPEALGHLEVLLAGRGREIRSFACVEAALAAARGEYDLAVFLLDGGWWERGAVEAAVERALAGCAVFWLSEEETFGEPGGGIPDQLLNYCMPSV